MLNRATVPLLMAFTVASTSAIAQPTAPTEQAPFSVTTTLPADTVGVLLINTEPAAWAELNRFNPLTNTFPALPVRVPFLPPNFDYSQDIQPWIGDHAAIALLPNLGPDSPRLKVPGVLLAPVRHPERLTPFLDKIKASRGQPQVERDYKGVTILEWFAPPEPNPLPSPETVPNPEESPSPEGLPTPLPSPLPKPGTVPNPTGSPAPEGLPIPQEIKPFPNPSPGAIPPPKPLPIPQIRTQRVPIPGLVQFKEQFTSQLKAAKATPDGVPPALPPVPMPNVPMPSMPLPNMQRGLAIALLPGQIVLATDSQPLEQLIDAREQKKPLADNPLFQRSLKSPESARSLLIGYGDVAGLTKFVTSLPTPLNAPLPLPPSALSTLGFESVSKLYNTADLHVWVQPEGVRSQISAYYITPSPDHATVVTADANEVLTRLPAATYLSVNSRNFNRQWQSFVNTSEQQLLSQLFLRQLRQFTRNITGLDLDKDVTPWIDGEYAFFMFPTNQGFFNYIDPRFKLGLGVIIKTSDRPAAEAALKKLDQYVKSVVGKDLRLVTQTIQGQSIVSWEGDERGKTLSVFAHGWVDQNTLIITTGKGPMTELNPKPYQALNDYFTFKAATAGLPQPNEGYFYVNMGSSLSFLYGFILPQVPNSNSFFAQEIRRVLGTIRSISTANSATAEKQQLDSLWVLTPTQRP